MKNVSYSRNTVRHSSRDFRRASTGPNGLAIAPTTKGPKEGKQKSEQRESQQSEKPARIPRIRVGYFAVTSPKNTTDTGPKTDAPDKSHRKGTTEQDAYMGAPTFTPDTGDARTAPQGVEIRITATPQTDSSVLQNRWTQTITTNDPLHGAVSPYVDPYPNDDPDGGPFYYTTSEHTARGGTGFYDHPSRLRKTSKDVSWKAVLSYTSVRAGKKVEILESITYGFTIKKSDGAVVPRAPTAAGSGAVAGHVATLSREFGRWNFKKA